MWYFDIFGTYFEDISPSNEGKNRRKKFNYSLEPSDLFKVYKQNWGELQNNYKMA